MPIKGRLKKLSREAGFDDNVKAFVKAEVKKHGSEFKAAQALGVYPNAIHWHLTKSDRKPKTA